MTKNKFKQFKDNIAKKNKYYRIFLRFVNFTDEYR